MGLIGLIIYMVLGVKRTLLAHLFAVPGANHLDNINIADVVIELSGQS